MRLRLFSAPGDVFGGAQTTTEAEMGTREKNARESVPPRSRPRAVVHTAATSTPS